MTWQTFRVKDVAEIVNGYPFDATLFSDAADVPLIRIRDIQSSSFTTFLPTSAVPPEALVSDGDIVIGMDGDFNCVLWSRGSAALNQRLCLLRTRSGFDERFLAYALPPHLRAINDITYATTVRHLSSRQVADIRLAIPEHRLQRVIADYLDRETAQIDTLIAKQEQLITTLRERRDTVIRKLTTGSGPLVRLRRVASIMNGGTPTADSENWNGEIPFVTPPDLRVSNGGVLRDAARSITDRGLRTGSSLAPPGSVLTSIRAPIGYVSFVPHAVSFNQGCRALTPTEQLDARFLAWVLYGMSEELQSLGRGTTFLELSATQTADIQIPLPSLSAQQHIVSALDDTTAKIDALIAKAERFIELSKERRAALTTAAVTGQLAVPA